MKKLVLLVALVVTVAGQAWGETLEQEATRVCSEYSNVKKQCYYKAVKGILPVNGLKGIKKHKNIPDGIYNDACQEGFSAFGRAGKVPDKVVNQAMQATYTQCYEGFIAGGKCNDFASDFRSAITWTEAYFADNNKYPTQLGYRSEIGTTFKFISKGDRFVIVGSSDRCKERAYSYDSEAPIIQKGETYDLQAKLERHKDEWDQDALQARKYAEEQIRLKNEAEQNKIEEAKRKEADLKSEGIVVTKANEIRHNGTVIFMDKAATDVNEVKRFTIANKNILLVKFDYKGAECDQKYKYFVEYSHGAVTTSDMFGDCRPIGYMMNRGDRIETEFEGNGQPKQKIYFDGSELSKAAQSSNRKAKKAKSGLLSVFN